MSEPCTADDDVELVPIPLDREDRALLVKLAAATGDHPVRLAAALLRDVLRDDAAAHAPPPLLN